VTVGVHVNSLAAPCLSTPQHDRVDFWIVALTHAQIDARSLALHRLVAEKVRREPQRFVRAGAILARWRREVCANTQPYLEEWERLFHEGMEQALKVATEDSERADALRQSSPLACVLTPAERVAFLKDWRREHDAGAA
jgi:hypothetical protein